MTVENEGTIRSAGVEAYSGLKNLGRYPFKEPRGEPDDGVLFLVCHVAVHVIRIRRVASGVIGNLYPREEIYREAVDFAVLRVRNENRKVVRRVKHGIIHFEPELHFPLNR